MSRILFDLNKPPFDWAFLFQWIMATALGWILGRFLLPNLAFFTVGMAMGILQGFVLQHRLKNAWWWIVTTAAGCSLASLINQAFLPEGMDFAAGLILGIGVGMAQWLVLRREVPWSGWWIAINIVAWTTGLKFLPGLFSTSAMIGLITGIAMELLLRSPKKTAAKTKPANTARI